MNNTTASDYLYSKYGIAIHSENENKVVIKPKDLLKYMEEYRKQGDYFTPDEIRKIQELAYEAGVMAESGEN